MGRPSNKKYVQVLVYLPRDIVKEIKKEAIDRDMTLGELVLEAFATRLRMVDKGEAPK